MTRFRQWVLVLVLGAVFLAGIGGLMHATPASAQAPSPGQATVGPTLGFPFSLTFPYVGEVPVQTLFGTWNIAPTYSTLTSTPNLYPFSAYSLNPLAINGPVAYAPSPPAVPARVVSSQTNGMYCKDKTGGMVWVPTGAPPDPLLTCGAAPSSSN